MNKILYLTFWELPKIKKNVINLSGIQGHYLVLGVYFFTMWA